MRSSQPRMTAFTNIPGVDWQGLARAVANQRRRGWPARGRRHDHHAACPQYGADLRALTASQAEGSVPRAAAGARVHETGNSHALSQSHLPGAACVRRWSRGGGVFRQARERPDAGRGRADRRTAAFALARQPRGQPRARQPAVARMCCAACWNSARSTRPATMRRMAAPISARRHGPIIELECAIRRRDDAR